MSPCTPTRTQAGSPTAPSGGWASAASVPDRQRLDARLLVPALTAWACTAGAIPLATSSIWWLITGVVAVGAVGFVFARRRGRIGWARVWGLAVVVTVVVLGSLTVQRATRAAGPIEQLAADRATVAVTAQVHGDPRLLSSAQPGSAPGAVVRVVADHVEARGVSTPVKTPLLVFGSDELLSVRWGQRVHVSGRLRAAEPADDVQAILQSRSTPRQLEPAGVIFEAADHVRARLREAVAQLPASAQGLVPAMVIGDRTLTPRPVTDDMLATGLTHLSAVSGSNVTFVLGAVALLARGIGLRRRWRPLLAAGALVGFVILARPDPSVLRASVMGATGLLGVMTSRNAVAAPALAAAVIGLLVVDPWLATSYSFALSVLATLGLLVFARPWGHGLAQLLPRWARPVALASAVSMAAQVVCGPIVVLLQGSVPVIGVVANVLAAPLVAPVTIGGLLTAVLALCSVPAAQLFAWLPGVPAWLIAGIAHLLADVPGGTLPWPDGALGAGLLAGLTVMAVAAGPALSRRVRRGGRAVLAGATSLVLVVWLAWAVPLPRWLPGRDATDWHLAACDVGQGDALVIATGRAGHALVVDVGPDADLVDDCLRRLGVEAIDALVLTHYDFDHVGGIEGALNGRAVAKILVSAAADTKAVPQAVAQAAARGVPVTPMRAGDQVQWATGTARVLNPAPAATTRSDNDNSIVVDVQTCALRALLLGDAEVEATAAVLRQLDGHSGQRPFDVVKVSHHGSKNVVPGLYRRIRARLALISVGAQNTYGHPAPSVLAELAAAGTAVWRTDEHATIVVSSDQAGPTPAGQQCTPAELTVGSLGAR